MGDLRPGRDGEDFAISDPVLELDPVGVWGQRAGQWRTAVVWPSGPKSFDADRRHNDGGVIAVTMIASTSLMLRLRCGIVLF